MAKASAHVEPSEVAIAEAVEAPAPAPEKKDHFDWAKAKGHLKFMAPLSKNEPERLIYTFPIYAAARTMKRWVIGSLVTEAEYDAALEAAGKVGMFSSAEAAKLHAAR